MEMDSYISLGWTKMILALFTQNTSSDKDTPLYKKGVKQNKDRSMETTVK